MEGIRRNDWRSFRQAVALAHEYPNGIEKPLKLDVEQGTSTDK